MVVKMMPIICCQSRGGTGESGDSLIEQTQIWRDHQSVKGENKHTNNLMLKYLKDPPWLKG